MPFCARPLRSSCRGSSSLTFSKSHRRFLHIHYFRKIKRVGRAWWVIRRFDSQPCDWVIRHHESKVSLRMNMVRPAMTVKWCYGPTRNESLRGAGESSKSSYLQIVPSWKFDKRMNGKSLRPGSSQLARASLAFSRSSAFKMPCRSASLGGNTPFICSANLLSPR